MPLSPAHSGAAGTPGVVLRLEGPGASESEPRMLLKTQGVGKITCESGFGLRQCARPRAAVCLWAPAATPTDGKSDSARQPGRAFCAVAAGVLSCFRAYRGGRIMGHATPHPFNPPPRGGDESWVFRCPGLCFTPPQRGGEFPSCAEP